MSTHNTVAPTWHQPRWTSTREVAFAFMVGYTEASTQRFEPKDGQLPGWVVPRYLELVCAQLVQYAERAMCAPLAELTPEQARALLLAFSQAHAVVRGWDVNLETACYNAGNYLRALAALEALE